MFALYGMNRLMFTLILIVGLTNPAGQVVRSPPEIIVLAVVLTLPSVSHRRGTHRCELEQRNGR